jgi:hypothetical protein
MEALVLNKSVAWLVVSKTCAVSMLTITGHAGLAGNTSGDDNDLSTLEGVGET